MAKTTKVIKGSGGYGGVYAVQDPFLDYYWDVNTGSNTVFNVDSETIDQYLEVLTKIKKQFDKKENH